MWHDLLQHDLEINLGLEVVVLAAAVLLLVAVLGRVDHDRPECRRCRRDVREMLWATATASDASTVCMCGQSLMRRGRVRWGGWRPMWRIAVCASVLLIGATVVRGWAAVRAADGVLWRDVLPVEPLLATIESGPGPWPDDYAEMHRRFVTGRLSDDQAIRAAIAQRDGFARAARAADTTSGRALPHLRGVSGRSEDWTAESAPVHIRQPRRPSRDRLVDGVDVRDWTLELGAHQRMVSGFFSPPRR